MQPSSGTAAHPDTDSLAREVEQLKQRVAALEQRLDVSRAGAWAEDLGLPQLSGEGMARLVSAEAGALPLLGRALLGLAGAYILRALTENRVLPPALGVLAAVAYAVVWLVWAVRTPRERPVAAALHGMTAALVLYPMLWETTVRFQMLTNGAAAGVLAVFAAITLAIAWRTERSPVVWIITLGGLATTTALIFGTNDMVPFVSVLLLIAASIEFSACRDHWLGVRWAAAAISDMFVLLTMFLVTREGGLPQGYAPIPVVAALALQATLPTIYLSSTAVRTLVRGLHITFFEIAQTATALALFIAGSLRMGQGSGLAAAAVAVFLLAGGAFCYLVAFAWLERRTAHDRNFYTYSTFGLLLVVVGLRLLLSQAWRAPVWCVLAITAAAMARRHGRDTLVLHSVAYTLFAAVSSTLLVFSVSQIFGGDPQTDAWRLALILCTTVAAAVCYATIVHETGDSADEPVARAGCLALAAICLWGAAGLLHWAALAGIEPSPSISAVGGTLILTAMACALAWGGRRWDRDELVWLVFPVMIIGAYKLIDIDFPQARTHAVSISLVLYGGALLVLPRLLKITVR